MWARFSICTNLVGCSTVDLGISKKDPHTHTHTHTHTQIIIIKRMDECLVITIIYIYIFLKIDTTVK